MKNLFILIFLFLGFQTFSQGRAKYETGEIILRGKMKLDSLYFVTRNGDTINLNEPTKLGIGISFIDDELVVDTSDNDLRDFLERLIEQYATGGESFYDSLIMQSKYGNDTAKAALRLSIASKVNTSDTANMLAPYALKTELSGGAGGVSGRYDPAATYDGVVIVDAVTSANYLRIGDIVQVSGSVQISTTSSSGVGNIYLELPVASNFISEQDATGTISSIYPGLSNGYVMASPSKDSLHISFETSETNISEKWIYFTVMYYIRGGSTPSAPTANAGTDQVITLPTNSVSLSGSSETSEGQTIISRAWTQISGPNTATFSAASSANTNASDLIAGTYVFRYTVTDNYSQYGYDEIQITVNAENVAPTANAGTDQTINLPTTSVTLSGSGEDSDGTIVSYNWTKISGGSATITSASSASTTVTGLTEGVYVFRLTVTDNDGATGTDDIQITVDESSGESQYLYVNFIGSTGTGTVTTEGWNNVNTSAGTNVTSGSLNWSDGSNSGITTTFSLITTINDNGDSYTNSNTTEFPNMALRMAVSIQGSGSLILKNVPDGTYKITILASRSWASSRSATYTCGVESITIEAQNNRGVVGVLDNLSPSDGELVIEGVSTVSGTTNFYFNAIKLEKKP